jgi:hypothetical protein
LQLKLLFSEHSFKSKQHKKTVVLGGLRQQWAIGAGFSCLHYFLGPSSIANPFKEQIA